MSLNGNQISYCATSPSENYDINTLDYVAPPVNYPNHVENGKSGESFESSPIDSLAMIFINAFDTTIDEADRTTALMMQLQSLVIKNQFEFLKNFLSHQQATRLHPSIMLGALFVTENIEELRDSWTELDVVFKKLMNTANGSTN